jgi:hypothetical protein
MIRLLLLAPLASLQLADLGLEPLELTLEHPCVLGLNSVPRRFAGRAVVFDAAPSPAPVDSSNRQACNHQC